MLLARVGFDLLRSPIFHGHVKGIIQKKLNELRVPDYIHSLEVGRGLHDSGQETDALAMH